MQLSFVAIVPGGVASLNHRLIAVKPSAFSFRISESSISYAAYASGIRHPAPGTRHPAPGTQHPATSIQQPLSSIQHPVSKFTLLFQAPSAILPILQAFWANLFSRAARGFGPRATFRRFGRWDNN